MEAPPNGMQNCFKCKGTGKIQTENGEENCNACRGTKFINQFLIKCPMCLGTTKMPTNDFGLGQPDDCRLCNLNGFIDCLVKPCIKCSCKGKITEGGKVDWCPECQGKGFEPGKRVEGPLIQEYLPADAMPKLNRGLEIPHGLENERRVDNPILTSSGNANPSNQNDPESILMSLTGSSSTNAPQAPQQPEMPSSEQNPLADRFKPVNEPETLTFVENPSERRKFEDDKLPEMPSLGENPADDIPNSSEGGRFQLPQKLETPSLEAPDMSSNNTENTRFRAGIKTNENEGAKNKTKLSKKKTNKKFSLFSKC